MLVLCSLLMGYCPADTKLGLQNALSPTTLSVIQMDEAGKLNWHSLRYSQDTSVPLGGGKQPL